MRRILPAVLTAVMLAGCGDIVQRYRTVGLTENQRTDLVLFEMVVRFVADSFGGPFTVQSMLSNRGWPTVGLEPDSSRADQDLSLEARRAVLRRMGIGETTNSIGSGCVVESKWEVASGLHEYDCPASPEVRVGIGPFYQVRGQGWLAGDPNILWTNVIRMEIGPRGFVLWNYDFEVRRSGAGWRVAQVLLRERVG